MAELYSTTMYQTGAKGETRVWNIRVNIHDENPEHAIITRSHGVLDGKMNEVSRIITTGKNIGKSNETTPYEQAILEAKSVAKKKSDEGYSETIEERGVLPVVLPMLAHDWNKVKKTPNVPLYVQPKIDGVRMIAVRGDDDTVVLTTRKGKPIVSMEHIAVFLRNHMPKNFVLDGELFSYEKTFEEITGIVRRNTPKKGEEDASLAIKFHVFDAFVLGKESMPFVERSKLLDPFRAIVDDSTPLVIVDTKYITTREQIDDVHHTYTGEGHEGTMYRTPSGPYKIRLRSRDLLKRKDFETEEYKIVDAVEADGKDKGTVIWVCETEEGGTRFNVRSRGTLSQRGIWWDEREEHIGKMLTVRFQNLSEFGVPRFPVGLTFRDYE
jgi:ATP-dependent DNA ligase